MKLPFAFSSICRGPFVFLATVLTTACASGVHAADTQPSSNPATSLAPVTISVDAGKSVGDFRPIYRFFGYDEPNFTYMPDGKALLGELGQLSTPTAPVFIRCHHLFTSGDGSLGMKWGSTNIYTEDAKGNPVYDFTVTDKIFDTYMQSHVKPYVQLGFMPKDLSTRPDLYPVPVSPDVRVREDGGQAYPPKDFDKWRELVRVFTQHCVDRYGKDEAQSWSWEVWNEPNILYWKGTPAEFFKLYDYAVDGVREALPNAKVGGPESAGDEKFTRAFLQHCADGPNAATGKSGSPLDFISFHAKGSPSFPEKHVRMGLGPQLNRIDKNFAVIEGFPQFRNLPVVIGESDPDGMAARPVTEAPQLGYRNTSQFAAYTADAITRTLDLAELHHTNIEGALTWSFEFENKPYFPGFRILSTHGIDLPVLNVFKMLAKMGGQRVSVSTREVRTVDDIVRNNVRSAPDVNALATLEKNRLCVLIYNYHDDAVPAEDSTIDLTIQNLPASMGTTKLTQYRIDQEHSNAHTVWQSMGSPQPPTAEQIEQLKKAGALEEVQIAALSREANGNGVLHFALSRQSVSLIVVQAN